MTCLRALGIPCEEGPLAAAAGAGPFVGTDPILLQRAINGIIATAHVHCNYRVTGSLDNLHTPFIATMWIPPIGGHYVAVLDVSPDKVIVGDPLDGRCTWDRHEFEHDWKHAAHEFSRDPQ